MNAEYSIQYLKQKVEGEREFWNGFLKTLLKTSSSVIDKQLEPIVQEVSARINCRECANCCTKLEPGITEEEMKTLASLKTLPTDDFQNIYIGKEEGTEILFLKNTPCIFLTGKECSIYVCKPASCTAYPGLDRKEIKYRLRRVFSHLTLCPIIYHTFSTLHQRYYDRKKDQPSE